MIILGSLIVVVLVLYFAYKSTTARALKGILHTVDDMKRLVGCDDINVKTMEDLRNWVNKRI
jgi:hypothetical protein